MFKKFVAIFVFLQKYSLNFVRGEDYIDLRYLDIEAPDGAGIDFDLHPDGGNTKMYQQNHDNDGNIEILAEFVSVALEKDDIKYTPEILLQLCP